MADLWRPRDRAFDGGFAPRSSAPRRRRPSLLPTRPPCSLPRHGKGTGTLDAAGAPNGFTGVLTYDFTPAAGSSCGDLVSGSTARFSVLPCGFAYDITATKAAAATQ